VTSAVTTRAPAVRDPVRLGRSLVSPTRPPPWTGSHSHTYDEACLEPLLTTLPAQVILFFGVKLFFIQAKAQKALVFETRGHTERDTSWDSGEQKGGMFGESNGPIDNVPSDAPSSPVHVDSQFARSEVAPGDEAVQKQNSVPALTAVTHVLQGSNLCTCRADK
jgi:hypothetical protein